MNKMGFGLLRLPQKDGKTDFEKTSELVDLFLEKGGRYFDTAYTYLKGDSEKAVRECLVRRHPRESFEICDKIPGYKCMSRDDCRKFLNEMKERTGVDHFDVLMLHWLNQENYDTAEKYDEFGFLSEMKEQGIAKKIGFSYHDSASLLETILERHPEVDVVQIQLNYLDWDSAAIESRKCMEVIASHGMDVYVMEPAKGGTLTALPEEAEALLREYDPERTPASWAYRFAQSPDEVKIVLSGMNEAFQIEENMKDVEPVSDEEKKLLRKAAKIIEGEKAVPCTGCRYCVDQCIVYIPIPDYFRLFNEMLRYPQDDWKIKPAYRQISKGHGLASECVGCRQCEKQCPQGLPISEIMRYVKKAME